jgi:glycosyltransferase involved in cell wall biosynthesis
MLDVSPRMRRAYYLFEKILSRFGGTIVACGGTEYEHALKIGKAILINNGVDMELVDKIIAEEPQSRRLPRPLIGTSGRISYQKNPGLFRALAESFPQADWVWIGEGEMRGELDASETPIDVTGWKSREETMRLVSGFDIYVQTSSWEGMPISILEAMALGKPVVATAIVGNKDLVKDGVTGFLGSDLAQLKNGIERLIADPELLRAQGIRGRERVLAEFDAKRKIEEWSALYRSIARTASAL